MLHMSKRKETGSDRVFAIVTFLMVTFVFVVVAYPLYFVIIASISDPSSVAAGKVTLYPIGINFDGYAAVLKDKSVVLGFWNSILYTVLGTAVNLIVTIPAAFALSRKNLRGKGLILLFCMIPMYISGGMIPTYLVVRQLNMLDTIWCMVFPGALSVYNMIIARTFFKTNIDEGLVEAAKIDGCTNARFFFSIALPLSKAIIAIMVLYYGIGHWNEYFSAMIYFFDKDLFPLQLVMRGILIQNQQQREMVQNTTELLRQQQVAELMKYSLIVISSIPVLILYPFIQKHFVQGVMLGSLKG